MGKGKARVNGYDRAQRKGKARDCRRASRVKSDAFGGRYWEGGKKSLSSVPAKEVESNLDPQGGLSR